MAATRPEAEVIPRRRDRRGGWNRNQPVRHDGPTRPQEAPRDPIAFINSLTHTKGEFGGQRFNLRPWQVRIVKQLFRRRKDGRRQYRSALLMLPRKNGKSELGAALALYGLLADGEIGAEVYSAAADRDQASLIFNVAAQMVRNDPELDAACYIVPSQKRIEHRASGSVYRAISADAPTKFGYNASMVLYDELLAAPNRLLYEALSTAMGGRKNPMFLSISTAGYDRHSLLWELYSHAKRVLENPKLDPTFLPILYEAPIDADWTDEKVWRKANPALGDFRDLEEMRILARRAKEIPAQENTFRRLYLNQWTEQSSRWLQMPAWDACQTERRPLLGRPCYVGMDLSATQDLTALVAVFPDDEGFDVLVECFVPDERLHARAMHDRVPFPDWVRGRHLTAISGKSINYQVVRAKLLEWREDYDVRVIGYDPWNAHALIQQLEEEDRFTCVKIQQTFAGLSSGSKTLERAILTQQLRHDGHPVLRWCVSNVAVESDPSGNLKPSKVASTERIDAVVALIMAVDVMDRNARTRIPDYAVQVVG